MKIEVKNLSYSYDNKKTYAVSDASCVINEHDFLAISGHTEIGRASCRERV